MKPTIYVESLEPDEILRRPSLASLVREVVVQAEAEPETVALEYLADGRLVARTNGEATTVQVKRCFPWLPQPGG